MRRKFTKSFIGKSTRYSFPLLLSLIFILSASLFVYRTTLFDLLASSISSLTGASTTVFFVPYGDTVLVPGSTTSIDIDVNTKISINALGATIFFPKDNFEIVSISKEKSFFDLWTEDTAISEDTGEIRFSGGTTKMGGVIGTGTMLTIVVRAKNAGSAEMAFKNVQVYPNNGSGRAIDTQIRGLTFTVNELKPQTNTTPSAPSGNAVQSIAPNPDLNGDGKVTLIDLSILTFKMLGGYNPRYDLNLNGSVGLDDLSILLSKM